MTAFVPKKELFYKCCCNCELSIDLGNLARKKICSLTNEMQLPYHKCDAEKDNGFQVRMNLEDFLVTKKEHTNE